MTNPMSGLIPSDIAILDLLRKCSAMTVTDFQTSLGVTATAVRQRLTRLLAQGYIRREQIEACGRGRPSHRYLLTTRGRRKTGANFADLALALWQELRSIQDAEVRRGLLQRLSTRLAEIYSSQIQGGTTAERMASLAELFGERQVPFEVRFEDDGLPVLNAVACPYPDLAELDPTICAMERMLFSELLGEKVTLDRCRLDGDSCCTFRASEPASATDTQRPD